MIKQYRKKSIQSMLPWTPETDMERVSVSAADRETGSPKPGDMIAFDPANQLDSWLVAADFFQANYEEVAALASPSLAEPTASVQATLRDLRIAIHDKLTHEQDTALFNAIMQLGPLYAHPPALADNACKAQKVEQTPDDN